MLNLQPRCVPVNPGRPDHRPPAPRRPIDPHQLDPAARRTFEESLKATPGLKGRSMLVLLVLLDIARGKPWSTSPARPG
jgi:hypothetical protein